MRSLRFWVSPVALVALAACARSVTGTASVSGKIDAASFSSTVTAVKLTDENGKVTLAKLESTGRFQAYAISGHSYSISLVTGGKAVPLDFVRTGGILARTFHVNALAFQAPLGVVHELHGIPVGGFPVVPQLLPVCSQSCNQSADQTGDHQGDHQDACGDNQQSDQSGANEANGNNNDNQGEDMNGDGDLAVSDTSLPAEIGCGGGGSGEESDGETSDGSQSSD